MMAGCASVSGKSTTGIKFVPCSVLEPILPSRFDSSETIDQIIDYNIAYENGCLNG